ncbi:hypothetical protein C8Q70DRAFT_920538, partial [Cubamyces menziesii]
AALWRAIRREDVSKRARDFIWKIVHDAHRVGRYWSNIPGYETRATCSKCGVIEDMDHVLTKCTAAGPAQLWRLTRALLSKREIDLPDDMDVAFIAGSPLCEVKNSNGDIKTGDTRLLRIVLTETAHLIWRMRCERVIEWGSEEGKEHTEREIDNKWMAMLNARIGLDQAMTSARLTGRRKIAEAKVRATWKGTLRNEQDLPEDWAVRRIWVLVGKPDVRPNG